MQEKTRDIYTDYNIYILVQRTRATSDQKWIYAVSQKKMHQLCETV